MNEFEEWMGHYDCCPTPEAYSAAKAAYQAGAAAMREMCAEIADNEANGFRNTRIAAAIRGMEI